ncbi:hypothetical protein ALC62_11651 [Cyphomyrmex costatus]|uniref:Uncharacterized protein n=1 Tax=Cyphomyrmex costatus TaxID=456900 RepID=A0A151IC45_9HYME|nr:hypothetical protein ALC62_11651 [Cyphomyrmex costatus]
MLRGGATQRGFGDTGSRRSRFSKPDGFVRPMLAREIIPTKWSMNPMSSCGYTDDGQRRLSVMATAVQGASSLLVAITPMFPPFVGQCTIDFGYLCRDVTVRLILRAVVRCCDRKREHNRHPTHETLMSDFLARVLLDRLIPSSPTPISSNEQREDVLPAVLLSLSHDRVYSTRIASLFSYSRHRPVKSLGRRLKIRDCLSSGVVTSRFTEPTEKAHVPDGQDSNFEPVLYRFVPSSEIVREIPTVHQLLSNIRDRSDNRASFKLPLAKDTRVHVGLNRG